MFSNVIILTDLDVYHTPKTMCDTYTINDVVVTDFNIKPEVFYKAERIIYINKIGDIKVLKDRHGKLEREVKGINMNKEWSKKSVSYFTGNEDVNYILTRKGKKIKKILDNKK